MTPEELNRTLDFIIQSQACRAVAQEQDRQDRLAAEQNRVEFQEWAKKLFKQMADLLDHQSRRMDRIDKLYEGWLGRQGGPIS
jgi:hypothetical protein